MLTLWIEEKTTNVSIVLKDEKQTSRWWLFSLEQVTRVKVTVNRTVNKCTKRKEKKKKCAQSIKQGGRVTITYGVSSGRKKKKKKIETNVAAYFLSRVLFFLHSHCLYSYVLRVSYELYHKIRVISGMEWRRGFMLLSLATCHSQGYLMTTTGNASSHHEDTRVLQRA